MLFICLLNGFWDIFIVFFILKLILLFIILGFVVFIFIVLILFLFNGIGFELGLMKFVIFLVFFIIY